MIEIDGSEGEGGGQILRSSLSLAICTQQPFRIVNIRANRERPGLQRQHLTAVNAAAEICTGTVDGAQLGSRALTFRPGRTRGGNYLFDIGTAGSSTLVLQTVLPPLLFAAAPSEVRVTGGTHNPGGPPFEFLARAFIPLLLRMGADVRLELAAHGFYPRGGGEIRAHISPAQQLAALELPDRGALVRAYAEAFVAALPLQIAQRELAVIKRALQLAPDDLLLRGLPNDMGPGNVVVITLQHEHVTEVVTGFGEKGIPAEAVAEAAVAQARAYMKHDAPVGEHLADQLLLPMALGSGGAFSTCGVTPHLRSNAQVIAQFTGRSVTATPAGERVEVRVE